MERDNQEFLEKLDKFDRSGRKTMYRLIFILYAVFTCFILAATVYYVVLEFQGNGDPGQLTNCSAMLLVLAAIPVCGKMADLFIKCLLQKNEAFDPGTMELPAHGSVRLEDALHRMSTQTGAIVWDTIWGCVVVSLLCLLAFGMGDPPRILLLCVFVIVLTVVGHMIFRLLWKRRSFVKKMIRNTSKVIEMDDPASYAAAIEESLKRGVLCYEKELILTGAYILGNAERDNSYIPVAIPRAQVTEYIFFYQRIAGDGNSRTVGILRCVSNGKKLVDFVLGPQKKAEKLKKILAYYQISWREEKLYYV